MEASRAAELVTAEALLEPFGALALLRAKEGSAAWSLLVSLWSAEVQNLFGAFLAVTDHTETPSLEVQEANEQ